MATDASRIEFLIYVLMFNLLSSSSCLWLPSCDARSVTVTVIGGHHEMNDNNASIDGNRSMRFIDVGRGLKEENVYWRVVKTPFGVTNRNTEDDNDYHRRMFSFDDMSSFGEGNTRLDSPYHFDEKSWKIDEIPLNRLFVSGLLLDMVNETVNNSEFLLKPEHLISWENTHGSMPENSVLLINFGWAHRWSDKDSYFGLKDNKDGDTSCHFPGISEEAAIWIVRTKSIVGVGIDTASVDVGSSTDFRVHKILSSANIYSIENMNFKIGGGGKLPPRGFDLIIMPMKILGGSVAPCRVIVKLNATSPVTVKTKKRSTKRETTHEMDSEDKSKPKSSAEWLNPNFSCNNNNKLQLFIFVVIISLIK